MARWRAVGAGISLFAMLLTARAYGASESAALPASVSQASSTAAATAPSQWWLSAGVFRTDGAAEVRRAALIEHGVAAARVVEAQLAGAVVHRVVVGPFADRAQARSQLSAVRAVAADAFALVIKAVASAPTDDTAAVRTLSAAPASALPIESGIAPAPPPKSVAMTAPTQSDAALAEPPIERTRGISLQEYLRKNGGNTPTSPAVAPDGYQLNQLHRAGSVQNASPSNELHDVTPGGTQPRDQPAVERRAMDSVHVECVVARWWHWLVDAIF